VDGYNFASLDYYDTSTTTALTPFRVFSPNIGRWHSPDPLGGDVTNPQSLNRYAYVLNNPMTLTDPLGLGSEECSQSNEGEGDCGDPCDNVNYVGAECGGDGWPSGWPIWGGGGGGGGPIPPSSGGNTGAGSTAGSAGNAAFGGLLTCTQVTVTVGGVQYPTGTVQCFPTPLAVLTPWAAAFLGDLFSSATLTTTWNSLTSSNGCINQFWTNFGSSLNPIPTLPSAGDLVQPVASAWSAYRLNSALAYAASRTNYLGGQGLLYPFKSTVFSNLMSSSQSVLEATPMIQVDVALGQALYSEYSAAKAGECQ
jgi:RHS repeat-associated protein